MKERPIIFSGEMIRAILDDRKTQTRRPIKPQPHAFNPKNYPMEEWLDTGRGVYTKEEIIVKCPYGQPGDRLWAREAWSVSDGTLNQKHIYKADGVAHPDVIDASGHISKGRWRSSIFMPRSVSRITLEIVHVRANRLLIISEHDCDNEGCPWNKYSDLKHKVWFEKYWDSLYSKKPEYRWQANPWVWVIEFRKSANTSEKGSKTRTGSNEYVIGEIR